MRKELIWASIIGVSFGLVIAFGVWRINSSLRSKTISTEIPPLSQPDQEFKITLNKPEGDEVVTEDSVVVSGITKAFLQIAISGEEEDYITQSDQSGVFEQNVNLIPGVNQIKLTAFNPDGGESTGKVLVVYSSAFEEKGEDRLEKASYKPRAYLGTVTDITDSTIQIRSTASEIKQITTNKDGIAVVKTGTTNKVVKFADIAIGDFIVAMGYINGNKVLDTQRILITPPVTEPKITVAMGKGSDVTPIKSTKIYPKASDLKDESQIISVTTEVGGKSSLRTVFVIDKNTP